MLMALPLRFVAAAARLARGSGWFRLLLLLLVVMTGCITKQAAESCPGGATFLVSLPEIKLADEEYIQSVEVEIRCGCVVSINRFLDDWDTEVTWDHPGLLFVRCQARHFSAGFSNTGALAQFITARGSDECSMRVTAKVITSSTEPTGRPDREIAIGPKEMVLIPMQEKDRRGMVRDSRSESTVALR